LLPRPNRGEHHPNAHSQPLEIAHPKFCPRVGTLMTRERLFLFDTTLRDGQQTQGVQFSTAEKHQIARALDALGVDHIEGGWPGALRPPRRPGPPSQPSG
jgi:hypothetical protein